MHLKYGQVELKIEHTSEVSIRAVYDASGMDYLYNEITVGMVCVWSPKATVTSTIPPFEGDPLGVTVNTLKHTLMTPRQQLILTLGKDRAFIAPLNKQNAQGVDVPLSCDPGGGPFPEECRVLEVIGDKTAVVFYRVRFHTLDCEGNFVLSNRWRLTSDTDGESYLTTRVIEGRAVLRLDFALGQNPAVLIDQFRAAFVINPPPGFIRKRVHVVATEDGRELIYHVVDRQQALNLGVKSPALKVQCYVTVGGETPVNLLKGFGLALATVGLIEAHAHQEAAATLWWETAGVWGGLIPGSKANVISRVWGKIGAARKDLAALAVQLALDRFAPFQLGQNLFVVSAYMTTNADSEEGPYVELRMEFLVADKKVFAALLDPANKLPSLLKLDTDVLGPQNSLGDSALKASPSWGNPPFPTSNQSRGHWVGYLVTQALSAACTVPAAPPPPPSDSNPDTRKEYLTAK